MSVCSSNRVLISFAGSRKNMFEEFIIKTCRLKKKSVIGLKHFDILNNSVNSNWERQNPWLTKSAAYTQKYILKYMYIW